MNSLIIGNTSQLSYYFPSDYDKISSRNLNTDFIKEKKYNQVFLLFAEQRTFLKENDQFFIDINVNYTLKIIDEIKEYCENIIIYSTSELWNNHEGEIDLKTLYNYNYSPYIKSKEILCNYINENKEKYHNVHIVYPFNFNSPYRGKGFLFGKIFDSIVNKTKNTIGSVDFERDIIHPSIITKNSISLKNDIIIGSGELINVSDFINDMFKLHNLNINDYICFNKENDIPIKRKNYYSKYKYSNYSELLKLTENDIRKNIVS